MRRCITKLPSGARAVANPSFEVEGLEGRRWSGWKKNDKHEYEGMND
jgi:hypothetical protein